MNTGQAPNPPRVPPTSWRSLLWLLGLLLLFSYLAQVGQETDRQTLSYSAFKARVAADEVASVTIQGDRVVGELEAKPSDDPAAGPPPAFVTTLPPVSDPDLLPLLDRHGVEVHARSTQSPWWIEAIVGLLPWLLILGFFWYASRKMQEGLASAGRGGLFGFAKSRAKRFRRGQSPVTFADVAGLDNAKRDLREITSYLQAPERFRRLGAKIPKGVLLMGPPGTGKTLLAKAVAGEASVPFFSISGSEFIEMFVGVGASRVRDMFESAKRDAPSIILIDEIDSVRRARGTGLGGGHDEAEGDLDRATLRQPRVSGNP